jgi:hypothetical protein
MSWLRVVAAAIVLLTASASDARGQTPRPPPVVYARFFETLYAPFTQDVRANGGPALLVSSYGGASALNGLLVAQIINLPTGSNAGGFAWTYDPALGTWGRSSDSFGPQTGERSQTVGRRKVNFGFAYQRFTFDKLDGQSMSIESVGGTSAGSASLGYRERVSLSRADISVKTTFVNYGITSRIDVGVFMPVVSIAVDGSLDSTLRRGPGLNAPVVSQRTTTAAAREQRLGDPVFRGKYNFIRRPHGGVAVAFDGRFHTSNQLGAGGAKTQLIASANSAAINTHANVGFSGSNCNTEPVKVCEAIRGFFVAGGIDKAVTKRVTLSTTIHMQRVDIQRTSGSATAPISGPLGPCAQGIASACRTNLIERADTVTVSMTGKMNLWGNLLLTVTGLVPANSSGLTDRFTPIVGLDYAW